MLSCVIQLLASIQRLSSRLRGSLECVSDGKLRAAFLRTVSPEKDDIMFTSGSIRQRPPGSDSRSSHIHPVHAAVTGGEKRLLLRGLLNYVILSSDLHQTKITPT